MSARTVRLLDEKRSVVATAQVCEQDGLFSGSIDLSSMPKRVRKTFETYEEIVNGQMFSLLDEVEDEIGALAFTAAFESGCEAAVSDLQIYPSAGRVSFRLIQETADLRSAANT